MSELGHLEMVTKQYIKRPMKATMFAKNSKAVLWIVLLKSCLFGFCDEVAERVRLSKQLRQVQKDNEGLDNFDTRKTSFDNSNWTMVNYPDNIVAVIRLKRAIAAFPYTLKECCLKLKVVYHNAS